MQYKYFKIAFLSATTACLVLLSACKEDKKTVKKAKVTFKKEGNLQLIKASNDSTLVALEIEIADNEFETQTGLMYRDSMQLNRGMLFIFPDSQPRSFYMKNTRFPLDLIYLDANKTVVSFQENAQPLNENSLPSHKAAKYVLEVNAGLVATWQLKVGDKMNYTVLN